MTPAASLPGEELVLDDFHETDRGVVAPASSHAPVHDLLAVGGRRDKRVADDDGRRGRGRTSTAPGVLGRNLLHPVRGGASRHLLTPPRERR